MRRDLRGVKPPESVIVGRGIFNALTSAEFVRMCRQLDIAPREVGRFVAEPTWELTEAFRIAAWLIVKRDEPDLTYEDTESWRVEVEADEPPEAVDVSLPEAEPETGGIDGSSTSHAPPAAA
jgi:hypothetical protein